MPVKTHLLLFVLSLLVYVCLYVFMMWLSLYVVYICVSLAVIPEIIFPNDSFAGYAVNVTDPMIFECIATGIPPPTIQWSRDGVLLSSRVMLSEPFQTLVPAPMGTRMIYQVERTLTFNTTANHTGTYTCEASNINMVQPTVAQNFTLFVQGKSGIWTGTQKIRTKF